MSANGTDGETMTVNGRRPALLGPSERSPDGIYTYLRALILEGDLAPGSAISQVQLADQLGVSRTPLREAIRRLQQEGLIEAEVNRQARVIGFDADSLETVYTGRLLYEPLGLAITAPRLTAADLTTLEELVLAMRTAKRETKNFADWEVAHRAFHRALAMHAGQPLQNTISTFADQGERFRRLVHGSALDIWTVWDDDHELIFDACRKGAHHNAVVLLAKHLARTALSLLGTLRPDRDATQIRTALALLTTDRVENPGADMPRSKGATSGD